VIKPLYYGEIIYIALHHTLPKGNMMETSLQQNNSSQAGHLEKNLLMSGPTLMAKGQHQKHNIRSKTFVSK